MFALNVDFGIRIGKAKRLRRSNAENVNSYNLFVSVCIYVV